MKTINLKKIRVLLLIAIFSISSTGFAQRGNGNRLGYGQMNGVGYGQGYALSNGVGNGYLCNYISDLTTDQQAKLETLRTNHWKDIQNNKNLIAEKTARLNTLRSADNADLKAINKTIDEANTLRVTMQKNREKHIQDVRNTLTKEQRVYYDNAQRNRGQGQGRGRSGRGYGRGQGSRCGSGYGNGMGTYRRF